MFVDASVMIAILTGEDDGEAYARLIEDAPETVTSVLAVWEASAGLFRKHRLPMREAKAILQAFIDVAGIEVLPVDSRDEALALDIFETNGRHGVPERQRNRALNMADCFHYAVATRRGVSILTKDEGFTFTDLETIRVATPIPSPE